MADTQKKRLLRQIKQDFLQQSKNEEEFKDRCKDLLVNIQRFQAKSTELSARTESASKIKENYERYLIQQNPLLWSQIQRNIAVVPYFNNSPVNENFYKQRISPLYKNVHPAARLSEKSFNKELDDDSELLSEEGVWPHSPSPVLQEISQKTAKEENPGQEDDREESMSVALSEDFKKTSKEEVKESSAIQNATENAQENFCTEIGNEKEKDSIFFYSCYEQQETKTEEKNLNNDKLENLETETKTSDYNFSVGINLKAENEAGEQNNVQIHANLGKENNSEREKREDLNNVQIHANSDRENSKQEMREDTNNAQIHANSDREDKSKRENRGDTNNVVIHANSDREDNSEREKRADMNSIQMNERETENVGDTKAVAEMSEVKESPKASSHQEEKKNDPKPFSLDSESETGDFRVSGPSAAGNAEDSDSFWE